MLPELLFICFFFAFLIALIFAFVLLFELFSGTQLLRLGQETLILRRPWEILRESTERRRRVLLSLHLPTKGTAGPLGS